MQLFSDSRKGITKTITMNNETYLPIRKIASNKYSTTETKAKRNIPKTSTRNKCFGFLAMNSKLFRKAFLKPSSSMTIDWGTKKKISENIRRIKLVTRIEILKNNSICAIAKIIAKYTT